MALEDKRDFVYSLSGKEEVYLALNGKVKRDAILVLEQASASRMKEIVGYKPLICIQTRPENTGWVVYEMTRRGLIVTAVNEQAQIFPPPRPLVGARLDKRFV